MPRIPLAIHATPNAPRSEITGWTADAQGRPVLRVKLHAPPVEGRANEELIAFLSKTLGCARGELCLRRGANGRHKIVEMPEAARNRLPLDPSNVKIS